MHAAVAQLDRQHHHAGLLANFRVGQGFARQHRLLRHRHLFNFHVEPLTAEGVVNQLQHVRPQKQVRDAPPDEVVGRDHVRRPGALELGQSFFLAGARHNQQVGLHPPRGQHDVEVIGVGGHRRHQSLRVVNASLVQHLLAGGAADHDRHALVLRPLRALLVGLNENEGNFVGAELARHRAAHTARAADDVVVLELGQFALHAAASYKLVELEFYHHLRESRQQEGPGHHRRHDQKAVEDLAGG